MHINSRLPLVTIASGEYTHNLDFTFYATCTFKTFKKHFFSKIT